MIKHWAYYADNSERVLEKGCDVRVQRCMGTRVGSMRSCRDRDRKDAWQNEIRSFPFLSETIALSVYDEIMGFPLVFNCSCNLGRTDDSRSMQYKNATTIEIDVLEDEA
jgi:hypothetical protein